MRRPRIVATGQRQVRVAEAGFLLVFRRVVISLLNLNLRPGL